ncbi:MAG: hypothetical protein PHE67_00915 [Campylobacterales bacterium]|nr:hypothetical protein [Campylobacterales bacterium]
MRTSKTTDLNSVLPLDTLVKREFGMSDKEVIDFRKKHPKAWQTLALAAIKHK